MEELILLIFDWKVKLALLMFYILLIINYQASNNIADTFKSKRHKNMILLINVNVGLVVIILLITKIIGLYNIIK